MSPSSPEIRTLRSVAELRAALEPIRSGGSHETIGLVPTMGALHEGHLSLIRRAREQCDHVIVSLFVNPSQFNEPQDLESYPRQEERDALLASEAGADLLFAPSTEEVYPPGFATSVEVLGLTERLEGATRGASHFRGVTTVVCKLLNMVGPERVYFGQKDAQQVVVIRRLVSDLNVPVRVEVCPTVREPDGLAQSSRNARLDPSERAQARALYAGLSAAMGGVCDGERSAHALLRSAREAMLAFDLEPEYLALVDPETLEPMKTLDRDGLLAVAAQVGSVRLIDNVLLAPCERSPLPTPVAEWRAPGAGASRRHDGPASTGPSRKARTACSA